MKKTLTQEKKKKKKSYQGLDLLSLLGDGLLLRPHLLLLIARGGRLGSLGGS